MNIDYMDEPSSNFPDSDAIPANIPSAQETDEEILQKALAASMENNVRTRSDWLVIRRRTNEVDFRTKQKRILIQL
jgi:hypothetical protein